jgi:hypothetical protein
MRFVKSIRMGKAGHEAFMGNQKKDVTLTRRSAYKRPLGRLKA